MPLGASLGTIRLPKGESFSAEHGTASWPHRHVRPALDLLYCFVLFLHSRTVLLCN